MFEWLKQYNDLLQLAAFISAFVYATQIASDIIK